MKLIIAGGRAYHLTRENIESLNQLYFHGQHGITEVVHGGCSGVDKDAGMWGQVRGIRVIEMRAEWTKHGKRAGPIRNREMAKYADAVALFPGGKGTESMHAEAVKARLKIFDFRLPSTGRNET